MAPELHPRPSRPHRDLFKIHQDGQGAPSYTRASQGILPRRCWFLRNSNVILNGCDSAAFGEWMGMIYLRRKSKLMTTMAQILPICCDPTTDSGVCVPEETDATEVQFYSKTFEDSWGGFGPMLSGVCSAMNPANLGVWGPFETLDAMRASPLARRQLRGIL